MKTYLVMAASRGICHRHVCTSVGSAAVATRVYRKAGWAVVVLPEISSEYNRPSFRPTERKEAV